MICYNLLICGGLKKTEGIRSSIFIKEAMQKTTGISVLRGERMSEKGGSGKNNVKGMTYKDAGVDINEGDTCSEIMFQVCRQTWENRKDLVGEVIVPNDNFSGIRFIRLDRLKEGTVMGGNVDGVGTKIELAERTGHHRTIAYDLVAMVAEDAARDGGEPVLVFNILDVNSLDRDIVKEIALGLMDAARDANVAVMNGEIAELGIRVGGYKSTVPPKVQSIKARDMNYNWGAMCVWFGLENRLIFGTDIRPGDSLVGIAEHGFRSNGISLPRKVFEKKWGYEWHLKERKVAEEFLAPSTLYTRALVAMTGGYSGEPQARVKGIAHITGGGIPGKLGRLLKRTEHESSRTEGKIITYGATIESPQKPYPLMKQVQKWGNVSDEEAYKTWNMGPGVIIVTDDPSSIKRVAREFGFEPNIIGEVTRNPGVRIVSRGYYNPGKMLRY